MYICMCVCMYICMYANAVKWLSPLKTLREQGVGEDQVLVLRWVEWGCSSCDVMLHGPMWVQWNENRNGIEDQQCTVYVCTYVKWLSEVVCSQGFTQCMDWEFPPFVCMYECLCVYLCVCTWICTYVCAFVSLSLWRWRNACTYVHTLSLDGDLWWVYSICVCTYMQETLLLLWRDGGWVWDGWNGTGLRSVSQRHPQWDLPCKQRGGYPVCCSPVPSGDGRLQRKGAPARLLEVNMILSTHSSTHTHWQTSSTYLPPSPLPPLPLSPPPSPPTPLVLSPQTGILPAEGVCEIEEHWKEDPRGAYTSPTWSVVVVDQQLLYFFWLSSQKYLLYVCTAHSYVCSYVHMCVCMYVFLLVHTYCICICTYACSYVCTCVHLHYAHFRYPQPWMPALAKLDQL